MIVTITIMILQTLSIVRVLILSNSRDANTASHRATPPPDVTYSIVIFAARNRTPRGLRSTDMDFARFISPAVIRCDRGTIAKNPFPELRPSRVAALYINTVPGGPGTKRPSRFLLNSISLVSPIFLSFRIGATEVLWNQSSSGNCRSQ